MCDLKIKFDLIETKDVPAVQRLLKDVFLKVRKWLILSLFLSLVNARIRIGIGFGKFIPNIYNGSPRRIQN